MAMNLQALKLSLTAIRVIVLVVVLTFVYILVREGVDAWLAVCVAAAVTTLAHRLSRSSGT